MLSCFQKKSDCKEQCDYNGPSVIDLYQLLFVGLKLSGAIDWSWWVVMAPTICFAAVALLCLLVLGIITLIEKWK